MKTKFDLNLLNLFVNKNGVELVGEYDKLNRQSIIHGKCKTENCIGEFRKAFRTLFDNNSFYCDECMIQIKKSNIKDTFFKKYGVGNPSQLEEIKTKTYRNIYKKLWL